MFWTLTSGATSYIITVWLTVLFDLKESPHLFYHLATVTIKEAIYTKKNSAWSIFLSPSNAISYCWVSIVQSCHPLCQLKKIVCNTSIERHLSNISRIYWMYLRKDNYMKVLRFSATVVSQDQSINMKIDSWFRTLHVVI